MKRSKLTEEEIFWALKQADMGTPVFEVSRNLAMSEAPFFKRKQSMVASALKTSAASETSKRRIRSSNRFVAHFSQYSVMIQDALSKRL